MSFLTLFTADAAAAHGHEFSSPTSVMNRCWKGPSSGPVPQVSNFTSAFTAVQEEVITPPAELRTTAISPPPPSVQSQHSYSPPHVRKAPRTKTSYYLAQPPPGSKHHACSRASRALILQLQKGSSTARPLPTLDVLPSFVMGSKLKRVGQRFQGTAQQEVVFVTSEQFKRQDEEDGLSSDSGEEDLSSRRVVASVFNGTRRSAVEESKGVRTTMIRFDDGLVWEVNPLASGGYEFVTQDQNGLTKFAKWLPKSLNRRRSYQSAQQRPTEVEEKRYQFSILDNVTRKRPILAWMTPQKIDILDRHPGNAMGATDSPINTPPASILDVDVMSEDGPQYAEVSDQLREFIIVTGTWVALREGLTSNEEPASGASSPISSLRNGGSSRTSVGDGEEFRGGRLFRSGSTLSHDLFANGNTRGKETTTRPRRAHSVGSTALPMQSILTRTLGRSGTPSIPEPVPEQPTRSEDLVPASLRQVRAVSVPPAMSTPTRNSEPPISKSFPGRNRHSTPITLPSYGFRNKPSEAPRRVESPPQRSDSPVDLVKEKLHKRGRFGFRHMISRIFKHSSRSTA